MTASRYSDIGAVPVSNKNYTDIGAVPVSASNAAYQDEPILTADQKREALRKLVTRASPGDIGLNVLQGLATAGQNLNPYVTGLFNKLTGQNTLPAENQDFTDKEGLGFGIKPNVDLPLVRGTAQYLPSLLTSEFSLPVDIGLNTAYGFTQNPENPIGGAAITGGATGVGRVLGLLSSSLNPIASGIGRSLVGSALGGYYGGIPGAIAGAPIGYLTPDLLSSIGISKVKPQDEILAMVDPAASSARAEAGLRLGRPLSPAEATGRPDIAATQRELGKVAEGAAARVDIGQQTRQQEQAAIRNLKNFISPGSEDASYAIRKAANDYMDELRDIRAKAAEPDYKIAYTKKVAPNLVKKLRNSDRNISDAIDEAMSFPPYQVEGELLGEPDNSVKTLDYAKRRLDAKINAAKEAKDNDALRVLTKSKNKLTDAIDRFSPDYKKARQVFSDLSPEINRAEESTLNTLANLKDTQLKKASSIIFDPSQTNIRVLSNIKKQIMRNNPEAWNSIVRNEIERLTRKGSYTGKNFYNTVLRNDNQYNQFHIALDHLPEAQQILTDMKTSWDQLTGFDDANAANMASARNLDKFRSSLFDLLNRIKGKIGTQREAEALRYLYSPEWYRDVRAISGTKSTKAKSELSATMFSKLFPPKILVDSTDSESQ